jgi:hypothetical protein
MRILIRGPLLSIAEISIKFRKVVNAKMASQRVGIFRTFKTTAPDNRSDRRPVPPAALINAWGMDSLPLQLEGTVDG